MPAVLHPIATRVSSTSEAGVLEPEDSAWGTAPGAAAPLRCVVVPDPSHGGGHQLPTTDHPSRNARVEAERELFWALV